MAEICTERHRCWHQVRHQTGSARVLDRTEVTVLIASEGWQSGRMRRSWNLAAILLSLQLRPQQIPALVTALREGSGGHGAGASRSTRVRRSIFIASRR